MHSSHTHFQAEVASLVPRLLPCRKTGRGFLPVFLQGRSLGLRLKVATVWLLCMASVPPPSPPSILIASCLEGVVSTAWKWPNTEGCESMGALMPTVCIPSIVNFGSMLYALLTRIWLYSMQFGSTMHWNSTYNVARFSSAHCEHINCFQSTPEIFLWWRNARVN